MGHVDFFILYMEQILFKKDKKQSLLGSPNQPNSANPLVGSGILNPMDHPKDYSFFGRLDFQGSVF